jgi:hypothetical protein
VDTAENEGTASIASAGADAFSVQRGGTAAAATSQVQVGGWAIEGVPLDLVSATGG